MYNLKFVVVRLALLYFLNSAESATVEEVRLVGDNNDYINVRMKAPYSLRCTFRTGYDDPIQAINWYKDGRLVYKWRFGETIASAFNELYGKVVTTGDSDNLQHIRFNSNLSLEIDGNYTCEVVSAKETVKSGEFHLVVLDIPSDDFKSGVTLLGDTPGEALNETDTTTSMNCTLLWDFKTPAIFPRPNVTCGYYSYLHDDVMSELPAGLNMELLTNGSWQAGFEHIHISVAEIPQKERLGCSVSVPDTSYKRVVKFEDNFVIDHLIDSQGCNSSFLEPEQGLEVDLQGATRNCRGEVVPSSSEESLTIKIGCAYGKIAIFSNGTVMSTFSAHMICDPSDFSWSLYRPGLLPQRLYDTQAEIPVCVPNGNSAASVRFSILMLLGLSTGLLWNSLQ